MVFWDIFNALTWHLVCRTKEWWKSEGKRWREHPCVQEVGKMWAPAQPESAQLSLEPQRELGSGAGAPCLCHSATTTLLSPGTLCSTCSCLCWVRSSWAAASPHCWTQTLFWSFVLVGITELIEAKRLWEIAVFQEIKGFWILLHGYSSPYLILISLSFPRHIVTVEIYLWKHFAGGGPKYERFSVKSLGKRKN